MECASCKKRFEIPRNRKNAKYCSKICYQKKMKNNNKSFNFYDLLMDILILIVPILIIAGALLYITPKEEFKKPEKSLIGQMENIPQSSCYDEPFLLDEIEDDKFLNAIISRKK